MPAAEPAEPPYIVEPKHGHTHTLIFLHGRGDNGFNFGYGLVTSRSSSESRNLQALFPGLRFVFPTAQKRLCTRFNEKFTEWFDTWSLIDPEERSELQVDGIRDAVLRIHKLIEEEIAEGIPEHNIFLGGISQGFASSLHALLTGKYRLGGYVGMCGWMPFLSQAEKIKERAETVAWLRNNLGLEDDKSMLALDTPVFLCHGEMDNTINPKHGEGVRDLLKSMDMDVQWVLYPELGHWYKRPGTIDEMATFFEEKGGLVPVKDED